MLEIQTTFIFFPIVDVEISTCAEDALDLNVDDVDSRSLIRLYCVEILFVHRFLLVLVINKFGCHHPTERVIRKIINFLNHSQEEPEIFYLIFIKNQTKFPLIYARRTDSRKDFHK